MLPSGFSRGEHWQLHLPISHLVALRKAAWAGKVAYVMPGRNSSDIFCRLLEIWDMGENVAEWRFIIEINTNIRMIS